MSDRLVRGQCRCRSSQERADIIAWNACIPFLPGIPDKTADLALRSPHFASRASAIQFYSVENWRRGIGLDVPDQRGQRHRPALLDRATELRRGRTGSRRRASCCTTRPTASEAALKALRPYRLRGAEIVVADGASSDGTADLARGYADRVIDGPRTWSCR